MLRVLLAAAALGCPQLAAAPPNVLFIAVDDLNNRLGCYGDPVVKSPNIDRLAARGVRFDRAYCQYPLCNPSRTSFLSGRYPEVTKIFGNGTPPRTHLGAIPFLPEHFHANGYFTAKAGKLPHGAFDDAVKWDETEAGKGKKRAKKGDDDDGPAGAVPASVAWKALAVSDEATVDGQTGRTVVKFLEANAGKPFFIAAGFHKPHRPYEAPKKYFADYPADKAVLPQEPADIRKQAPAAAFNGSSAEDVRIPDPQKRDAIAAYHACITFMDAQVGLILDAVDRLKLWDNTVVVFASDHGYHLGEHGGMWRKMSLFEESARVPLVIAVPGKKPGVCPRTVELLDLCPTLCQLCGLTPPAGQQGKSLVPLLDDPAAAWERPALTVVTHGKVLGRSLRTERYRYTEWGPNGKDGVELYDHDADPKEYRNLAADPAKASTVADLKSRLRKAGPEVRP